MGNFQEGKLSVLPDLPEWRQKPNSLKQRPGRLFFSTSEAPLLVDHPTNLRLNRDMFTPKFWACKPPGLFKLTNHKLIEKDLSNALKTLSPGLQTP